MKPVKTVALREEAYRILGVDLNRISGMSVCRCKPSSLSWVRIFPGSGVPVLSVRGWVWSDDDVSGGKVLWSGARKVKNRVARTLRMAARSLQQSQSALGEFYRRMRAKLGAPKAITPAAHKLARITFHLLTTKEPYDDSVFAETEQDIGTAWKHDSRHRQKRRAGCNIKSLLRCTSRGYKNLHYLLLKVQRMAMTRTEFVAFAKAAGNAGLRDFSRRAEKSTNVYFFPKATSTI